MRAARALLSVALTLTVLGCARPTGSPSPAGSSAVQFQRRAAGVADAWLASPASRAWRTGLVPLGDPTVIPAGAAFTEATKAAFRNGWYRSAVPLSETTGTGTVRFADGHTLTVPVLGAAGAYRQLRQGDPPPCPAGSGAASAPGVPAPSTPDGVTATRVTAPCTALVITAARPATARLLTSRGWARVPTWRFTIAGLDFPIERIAVDPAALTPLPTPAPAASPLPEGVDGAVGPVTVDGRTVRYSLLIGACDVDVRPLAHEQAGVVVLGGTTRRLPGDCTAMGMLRPVSVDLAAPPGVRPLLDVWLGAPLTPYR